MASLLASFEHLVAGGSNPASAPLLLLHKTGGDEHELLPLAGRVAPERPVLAVRGQVVEAGKNRFFRRLSPGVFDEDDLRRRAMDLAAFLEHITAERSWRPPIALGLSNGANIAAALLELKPRVLSGAVLLRPAPPFAAASSNALPPLPILIIAGTDDTIVPPSDTDRLVQNLTAHGAEVTHRTIKAGHGLVEADVGLIRQWLAESPRFAPGSDDA